MKIHYPQESINSGYSEKTICKRYYLTDVKGTNNPNEVTCKSCKSKQ